MECLMKIDFFAAVTLAFIVGICITAIDFKSLFSDEAHEVVAYEVGRKP